MNLMQALDDSLKLALPGAKTEISEPAYEDGLWYLTVCDADHWVVVSWSRADRYFGLVSSAEGNAVVPHEVFDTFEEVFERTRALVQSKGRTTCTPEALRRDWEARKAGLVADRLPI